MNLNNGVLYFIKYIIISAIIILFWWALVPHIHDEELMSHPLLIRALLSNYFNFVRQCLTSVFVVFTTSLYMLLSIYTSQGQLRTMTY